MRSMVNAQTEHDKTTGPCKRLLALLPALLLLSHATPTAAQLTPTAPAKEATPTAAVPRELLWALPQAPLGAHCAGRVVCTDMGTWGAHARLTGATLIRPDSSLPGGLLTLAVSLTLGGWGEVGAHFPILLGPLGAAPLPLPPVLFAKGAFTPPFRVGSHGIVFASLTMPYGAFAAPGDNGQPMARRYEVGAALSGHLLWMLHYGVSLSGQFSPGGPASRLEAGLEVQARFNGVNVFAQPTYSAAFCERGSPSPDCQSSAAFFAGLQIPLVAGHASAAAGLSRGIRGQEGTVLEATLGASYDEATRAKYGDGAEQLEKLWQRLFVSVIDPYLDQQCMLWDDDHTPMVELGSRSADGLYCERNGLRTPIGTHFDRNLANTRVCYDKGLRNCILRRDSDKEPWQVVSPEQQARRPYLREDCHIYEDGAKLPLDQAGYPSEDGQACWWEGRRFPVGTKFWALPGEDLLCLKATLKDCATGLPPKPMSSAKYVASRADQGLTKGVAHLLETVERGPQVAADLASGRLHVQTVAGEAYKTLKDKLGHLTLEDTTKAVVAVLEAGKKELAKPTPQLLGDVAEAVGELPARALENEMTAGLGNLGGAARTGAKVKKAAIKAEHAVVKVEKTAAKAEQAMVKAEQKIASATDKVEQRVSYEHLPPPKHVAPGKDATRMQNREIRQENMKRNGGTLRDDETGAELVMPKQSKKGITPPDNEAHIDHIVPKAAGGTNEYSNFQVISRQRNLAKGKTVPK